jgi:hypothetical protein
VKPGPYFGEASIAIAWADACSARGLAAGAARRARMVSPIPPAAEKRLAIVDATPSCLARAILA